MSLASDPPHHRDMHVGRDKRVVIPCVMMQSLSCNMMFPHAARCLNPGDSTRLSHDYKLTVHLLATVWLSATGK